MRFFTAAGLVSRLEKEQKQYTLDRFLKQLDRSHLLICDELGYVTMSRGEVELLFRVFADRYERGSILVTSNLPFSEWGQVFQGERMTAALLDRLCHHCHIFEMNGESYRFRESMKTKKGRKRDFSTIAGDYRSLARWSTFIVSARGGPWISRNMSRAIRPRIVA